MVQLGQIVDVIEGQAFPRSEEIGCPICGRYRESRKILVSFGLTAWVAECSDCRIAFQTPRPSVSASLAYMNWRWRSHDAYVADPGNQMQRALKQVVYLETLVSANYLREADMIDKPVRIVDFGAGSGAFVRAALDKGWSATGIETSDSAMARAKEYYGVSLRSEFASQHKYHIVTMWDVVEHLRDPQVTLRMVGEHLVEDGLLFIETGNFESWLRLLEKDRWGLYLFDHQFYFTPSSLKQVLHQAGYTDFSLLQVNRSRPPIDPRMVVQHPIPILLQWLKWAKAKAQWPEHGDIDVMVVVARKKAGYSDHGRYSSESK